MEEDFILPEGEKPISSNKTFLISTLILLFSLIVLSSGVIALMLMERQEKMTSVYNTPSQLPTKSKDDYATDTSTRYVPQTATRQLTMTTIAPPSLTEEKGSHYIIIYINSTPSVGLTVTPTPRRALQIVPYPETTFTRVIDYTSDNNGG